MKGNSSLFGSYSSSPLHGQSQPYKSEYSVYERMLKKDLKHGIYDTTVGYTKNPTANFLDDVVSGDYIINERFSDVLTYVITTDDKVIIGKRNGNGKTGLQTPHPTLIGGKDPKVKMAGMLDIRGGKIYSYDNGSGHYRPNSESMKYSDELFKKYPKHKKYIGGINYDK